MPPQATQITELRDGGLVRLANAYDYFIHTKLAWQFTQLHVQAGHPFGISNSATGDAITTTEVVELANRYVVEELAQALEPLRFPFVIPKDASLKDLLPPPPPLRPVAPNVSDDLANVPEVRFRGPFGAASAGSSTRPLTRHGSPRLKT